METIVVGIDGSPGADRAVQFAAREARLRNARLRLVEAWYVPAAVYGDVGAAVVDAGAEYEEEAKRSLEEKVGQLEEELAGITIEQVVRQGRAATVLLEEASDAELLVVGSHGHGGFIGMLIGSVSNECARHAPCPVVIVRSAESEE